MTTPPLFTSEIRYQIKCAGSLRRRHELHPTDNTANKLKNLTGKLERLKTQAKKSYEETWINNLSSNRNYQVYHYIKRITGNTGIPNLLNLDDMTARSDLKGPVFSMNIFTLFLHNLPQLQLQE